MPGPDFLSFLNELMNTSMQTRIRPAINQSDLPNWMKSMMLGQYQPSDSIPLDRGAADLWDPTKMDPMVSHMPRMNYNLLDPSILKMFPMAPTSDFDWESFQQPEKMPLGYGGDTSRRIEF